MTIKKFSILVLWVIILVVGIYIGILAERQIGRHYPYSPPLSLQLQTHIKPNSINANQKDMKVIPLIDAYKDLLEGEANTFNANQKTTEPAPIKMVLTKMYHIKKGTLAYVNNNPFNLMFHGQGNSVKGKAGFAKFNTIQDGVNAGYRQIALDADRGHTLGSFINKYAPPESNDTEAYIKFLTYNMGINANQKMNALTFDLHKLGLLMMRMESNTKLEYKYYEHY
jgi:hypothetical protein